MAENSAIEWTRHTENFWIGCEKVHRGCKHCYAESQATRFDQATWGGMDVGGTRRKTSLATWAKLRKWDREAAAAGRHDRVFISSMADVFEEWPGIILDHKRQQLFMDDHGAFVTDGHPNFPATMDDLRRKAFQELAPLKNLHKLFLTKRPWNVASMIKRTVGLDFWKRELRDTTAIGTSVSDQATAAKWLPKLKECKSLGRWLFVSAEPLVGPVDLLPWLRHVDWVIDGGESGSAADPKHPAWSRSIRDQCQYMHVAYFHKQHGEWLPMGQFPPGFQLAGDEPERKLDSVRFFKVGKEAAGGYLDGKLYHEYPAGMDGAAA